MMILRCTPARYPARFPARFRALLANWLPALLSLTLLSSGWAHASSVWRCESGGRVTYADQPCAKVMNPAPGAVAAQRSVEVDDRRTAEQRQEAEVVAKLDERLLARMQQERRMRERQAPPPAAAAIIGRPADPLAKPDLRSVAKQAKPDRKLPAAQGGPSGARTSPATAPGSPRAAG